MEPLGERLGQAVGQCLEQDGVVVVVVGFEPRDVRLDADTRGDGERADPVLLARLQRGDEIGQSEVGALDGFVGLLAQEMQRGLFRDGGAGGTCGSR